MKATFTPAKLSGEIFAPASKSDAHRLLICAALADRPCLIENIGTSDDIEATRRCLTTLGAQLEEKDGGLLVTPIKLQDTIPTLDCGESGSTLRFLLPVAAALYNESRFIAHGGLNRRPLDDLANAMKACGTIASDTHTPLELDGKLQSGTFTIAGNVSSQYISGLLFALPMLHGDSRIVLTTPLSSAGYVQMTLDALKRFCIQVEETKDGWLIRGDQTYRAPERLSAEGDWSGAAFPLCAGALMGPVTVKGLNENSLQRDKKIAEILVQFGAKVKFDSDTCTVCHGELHGIELDADDIPDLVPPIALVAGCAQGTTHIRNCARLRIKESDRLMTVRTTLCAFGIEAQIEGDDLVIRGGKPIGAQIESFDDHRIAMMGAILAAAADGQTTLESPMAVTKSYPAFYDDYKKLGGRVHGIDLR